MDSRPLASCSYSMLSSRTTSGLVSGIKSGVKRRLCCMPRCRLIGCMSRRNYSRTHCVCWDERALRHIRFPSIHLVLAMKTMNVKGKAWVRDGASQLISRENSDFRRVLSELSINYYLPLLVKSTLSAMKGHSQWVKQLVQLLALLLRGVLHHAWLGID